MDIYATILSNYNVLIKLMLLFQEVVANKIKHTLIRLRFRCFRFKVSYKILLMREFLMISLRRFDFDTHWWRYVTLSASQILNSCWPITLLRAESHRFYLFFFNAEEIISWPRVGKETIDGGKNNNNSRHSN